MILRKRKIEVVEFIKKNRWILIVVLTAVLWSTRIFSSAAIKDYHFVYLASAFLKGKLYFNECIIPGDLAFYKGRYYVVWPPLPAIMLLPFVEIFGKEFNQQWLGAAAAAISFLSLYKIARKNGLDQNFSLWLATFLIFGTVFLSLTLFGLSSYLAQVVAITFLILALLENFSRKRWFLIGVLVACSYLTRHTLIFSLPFFIYEVIRTSRGKEERRENIVKFTAPVIIGVIVIFIYNFLRFGNVLETGHRFNINQCSYSEVAEYGVYGIISPRYIPNNLYYLLFKGPDALVYSEKTPNVLRFPYLQPSPRGMSIFILSPLLFFIFAKKKKNPITPALWLSIVTILIPSLLYFSVGIPSPIQFGYRYSLDSLPFAYILLILVFKEYKKPTLPIKLLIMYSLLFNFTYMLSIWREILS